MELFPTIDDEIQEVLDYALDWLLENPGAESLPYPTIKMLGDLGVDPVRAEFKLLMERDRLNS